MLRPLRSVGISGSIISSVRTKTSYSVDALMSIIVENPAVVDVSKHLRMIADHAHAPARCRDDYRPLNAAHGLIERSQQGRFTIWQK